MSFLDRLQFWRKSEETDIGLPPDLGSPTAPESLGTELGAGLPPLGEPLEKEPSFDRPNYTQPLGFERPQPQSMNVPGGRDLEIISLKLDAIKAELDSVNQRLIRVEKLVELNVKGNKATTRDIWASY